ncbi:MAG: hypothetical protein AB1Z23_07735 [Eubacteriales bacterium]
MKLSTNNRIILYITLIVLIIVVSVLSQMILFSYSTSSDKILPGVYINNVYVGGMTKEQATQALSSDLAQYLFDNNTVVINGDVQLQISAYEIANIDIDALVEKAYMTHRENQEITYFDYIKMKFKPTTIKTEAILDWQKIYNILEMNQHLFYKAPVDAILLDYSFLGGKLNTFASPDEDGYKINVWQTAKAVQESLANRQGTTYAVLDSIEPVITTQSILSMAENPITYTQVFPSEDQNAYNKYQNDLDTLNQHVQPSLLMPGQSISIKALINYDTYNPIRASFKTVHIPSIIYSCSLQSGLEIAEHHNSPRITKESEIYPYGQEAILDDEKDLVITNMFSHPVIIDLYHDNSNNSHKIVCRIYSAEKMEYTYIKSVIEQHDTTYYVKVYRVYANDTGGVLSRTLLAEQIYPVPPRSIKPVTEENIEQNE